MSRIVPAWGRRAGPICAWAVGAISLAWLLALRSPLFVNYDTARDWLQAIACAEGNAEACGGTPPIWFFKLSHGALWIRFLALGHELELSAPEMQGITLFFIAVGAGLVTDAARRVMSAPGAVMAGLVYAPLSLWVIQQDHFWNPTLLPLPIALFAWALLDHARTGRVGTAILAAIALAACCDLHLVSLALAPLFVIASVASARRPWLVALPIVTFGFSLWIAAPQTWAANVPPQEHYRLEYRLAVETGAMKGPQFVEIVDEDQDWQITAIEGVRFVGELPARRVTLLPRANHVCARRRPQIRRTAMDADLRRGPCERTRGMRFAQELDSALKRSSRTEWASRPKPWRPSPD